MDLADAWNQVVDTFRTSAAIIGGTLPLIVIIWVVLKIRSVFGHHGISHSVRGTFLPDLKHPQKMKSGGHGDANIGFLKRRHFSFQIDKTLENGVRLGHIDKHNRTNEKKPMGHAWFPKGWNWIKITFAGLFAASKKSSKQISDGSTPPVVVDKVPVILNKTDGKINTVCPLNPEAKKHEKQ